MGDARSETNIQGELTKLYAALTGERPGFIDVGDAATELAAKLEDKNCLVVIDDVWDPAHLKPFRRGGKGCARLVTTRQFDVAVEAARIDVCKMKPSEAVQMLIAPLKTRCADLDLLRSLAQRLGEWPLLLILAAGALRQRLERGEDPTRALAYLNRVLDKRGVTAFDRDNPSERDRFDGA